MKASIYSNTHLIGYTDLQVGDESMGCLCGEFNPTSNYFEIVQQKVWQFWASDKPNYSRWNALRFNVQLENGYFLNPMGGYTIEDMIELTDEPKTIQIAGVFRHVIDDYFKTQPPLPFVEKPWVVIDINQKIYLEDELQKEIKQKENSIFDFVFAKHALTGYNCSAVCKTIQSDDVLFSIYCDKNSDADFALVHLTFSGKKESSAKWPATTFFEGFDDFKFSRMYPDKAEWED